MATVLFTMADIEMAHFNVPSKPKNVVADINKQGNVFYRRNPKTGIKTPVKKKIVSPKVRIGGRQLGYGLRYGDATVAGKGLANLRQGIAQGTQNFITRSPGKAAAIAGGLAAAGAAGAYMLGRSRKKENYSRQIRTVYFSRRYN